MARSSRTRLIGGPVDISGQLWHYDRSGGYREVENASSAIRHRRSRVRDDAASAHGGYAARFSRFMSAGAMRHENQDAGAAGARRDGRVVVGRWLAALSALWIVFRFVEL